MKSRFSELYIRVCPSPQEGQIEKRWQGIDEYCKLDEVDIINLVMMAFGLKPSEEFKNHFVSMFQNIDMRFQKNFTEELSLLSCVSLMKLMKEETLKINIVLSVMCLSKYNIEIIVPELITQAFDIFFEKTAEVREKRLKYNPYSLKNTTDFIEAAEELTALDDANIQVLITSLSEIAKNFTTINENQKLTLEAMDVLKEDSDILSWITGGWSNELKKPIVKTTAQSNIALILAKELADLIKVSPGPYAFEGFLQKMLSNCKADTKTYSLVKMVDFIDREVKTTILNDYPINVNLQVNTPLLYSIKCALEANEPEIWKSAASNKLSINVESVENTILEWAKLMYFECMLVKLEGCE